MTIAAVAIRNGGSAFHDGHGSVSLSEVTGALVSGLILIGLWTPFVGALVALVEIWIAVMLYRQSGNPGTPLIVASVAAALAMLGPGAHSLDARLFGRKHIDLEQRRPD